MTALVLIVDDLIPNLKLIEARLSAEYFEVLTATNGADALALCASGKCDIVLLDLPPFERQQGDCAYSGRHGHGSRSTLEPAPRTRSLGR
jgi:DNA-binding NtrC family response regulator